MPEKYKTTYIFKLLSSYPVTMYVVGQTPIIQTIITPIFQEQLGVTLTSPHQQQCSAHSRNSNHLTRVVSYGRKS